MRHAVVKSWYLKTYPTDDMGWGMTNKITFVELFIALHRGKDFYDYMNAPDSIIRERVFAKLAEVMEVDYEYIYDQWLKGSD